MRVGAFGKAGWVKAGTGNREPHRKGDDRTRAVATVRESVPLLLVVAALAGCSDEADG